MIITSLENLCSSVQDGEGFQLIGITEQFISAHSTIKMLLFLPELLWNPSLRWEEYYMLLANIHAFVYYIIMPSVRINFKLADLGNNWARATTKSKRKLLPGCHGCTRYHLIKMNILFHLWNIIDSGWTQCHARPGSSEQTWKRVKFSLSVAVISEIYAEIVVN